LFDILSESQFSESLFNRISIFRILISIEFQFSESFSIEFRYAVNRVNS